MFKQYKLKNYKFILIALVVILNTIGVALVGSASPGDQKKQIIGMVSGIIIMLLVSYIDYNFILRFSWLIYLGAVGLLGLVIVAGEQSKGAQRWFKIGGFQFQPSELVKILMILFLAYYFMRHEEKINSPRVLFGSFVLIGIPLALILAQPIFPRPSFWRSFLRQCCLPLGSVIRSWWACWPCAFRPFLSY